MDGKPGRTFMTSARHHPGRETAGEFSVLLSLVDDFHVIIGLKDQIRQMLDEAFSMGYEQASADSCGCPGG